QRRIAEIVVHRAVIGIRTALGHQGHYTSGRPLILSVVDVLDDLLLLHCIAVGSNKKPSPVHRGGRSAINQDLLVAGSSSVEPELAAHLVEAVGARGLASLRLRDAS